MLGPEERGQLAFLHAAHEQEIRLFAFKHPGDDRAGDLAGELVRRARLRCEPPTVSRPKSWPRRLRDRKAVA